MVFHGHHDVALVALSVAIAVFASYTALDLAGRIRAATGTMRWIWLSGGAMAMGGGIWSMHFIAMLAFRLPVPINYDFATTLASLVAAVLVTGIGLFIVNLRQPPAMSHLLAAGSFMGIGVSAMHYTGMAAMQLPARTLYDPVLVALSVAIAVAASIVALWLTARVRTIWTRLASGCVMGAAIAGMHHTAMAAASYTLTDMAGIAPSGMAPELLAMSVAAATFIILALGLASSLVDQRVALDMQAKASVMQQTEERFRAIIDSALDAIVIMDQTGTVAGWNPQAEAIFGWSKEEAVGRRMADLIMPTRYKAAHDAAFARSLQTKEIRGRRLETMALHRSGREFPIEIAVSALSYGASILFSAFIRDITQRKASERDLREAKERAEAASQAKSAFLASVSHELRTPLNAIIGFSQIMATGVFGSLGNPKYQDYAKDIQSSGQHLLSVINDILDISRAEADRLELRESEIDMAGAIAASLKSVRTSADVGAVILDVQCPDDLPVLRADDVRIRQILINLLSNAVKFTERGGSVTTVARLETTGAMVLEVADTGIGMSEDQVAVALAPFGQVDSSLARKYGGTGLGLPLSRRLAELHGGTLDISSSSRVGTTVRVRFPAARVVPRRRGANAVDLSQVRAGRRIGRT